MQQDFFRYVAQTSPESIALPIERAEGIYLIGPDGKRSIDFIAGICVNNVGHGNLAVLEAIQKQSKLYLHPMVYGEAIMSPQVAYAKRLAELLPGDLSSVYFGNSGAEAIEGALKVARKYTGRTELIAFHKSYHGSTYGAMSVTGNEKKKQGYGPFVPDVHFLDFNSFEDLSQITEQTAGVVVEIIQGAGGTFLPEDGYLAALAERCQAVGALLIVDEIQTGLGRTGTLFSYVWAGIIPDILVLAKALGGGLPLGAFITRPEVMAVIQQNPMLGHLTTFGGHPLSCAAGLAALEFTLRERLLSSVHPKEKIIKDRLKHPLIKGLRGKGLMYAVLFEDFATAERIRKKALELGLITIGFLNIDNGLRISPPLSITEEEMHEACNILLAAMN
ncbi:MAG: aspartate aminotransferase family protein [Bacteroidia bacterium]